MPINMNNPTPANTPIRTIAAAGNQPVGSNDQYILVDATAGNIVLQLPTVATYPTGNAGLLFIKRIDASANTVTIDPFGAQQIEQPLSVPPAFAATAALGVGFGLSLVADPANLRWRIN